MVRDGMIDNCDAHALDSNARTGRFADVEQIPYNRNGCYGWQHIITSVPGKSVALTRVAQSGGDAVDSQEQCPSQVWVAALFGP